MEGAGSVGTTGAPTPSPAQAAPPVSLEPSTFDALKCTSITRARAFLELEVTWRDLFAHAASPSPFHSWDFAVEWWRSFVCGEFGGATGEFEIVIVRDANGRAVAILPFYLEHHFDIATLGLALQPFGRSVFYETMTDEPIALYRSGYETVAALAAKAHLLQASRDRGWDVAAIFAPVNDVPGPTGPRLRGSFHTAEVERAAPGPLSLRPALSWDTYRAALSKSMRDNLSYYPKKLSREVGPWHVCVVRAPAEMDAASDILIELHRKRSRAVTGATHRSHIPTDLHASFFKRWFRRAADRGDAEIYLLTVGSTVVAAQGFVSAPSCQAMYYSGFEERFHKYSPLTIITAEFLRAAINGRVGRVEFPPGMTAWKSRWAVRQRPDLRMTTLYTVGARALARGVTRRLYWFAKNRAPGGPPASALRSAA